MIKEISEKVLRQIGISYVVLEDVKADNTGDVYFYEGLSYIINLMTGKTEQLDEVSHVFNVCTTKDEVLDLLLKKDIVDKSGFLLLIKSNAGLIEKFTVPFDAFDINCKVDEITDTWYKENLSNIPISIARAMENPNNCVSIRTMHDNVICLNASNTLYIVATPAIKGLTINVYSAFEV